MPSLGIDAGTKSFKTCLMDGDRRELRSLTPGGAFRYLLSVRKRHPTLPVVLPSGFGIPVTEACALTERDIFEMTLKREETDVVGLGKFLGKVRHLRAAYCIPSVKLLPTVPLHRKLNKIDMGTSDKLCSAAFLLSELSKRELLHEISFIMCEAGFGFTSLVVVKEGKIIDGVGGSSLLGPLCRGAIDGELAYLHDFSKRDIYTGGYVHLDEEYGCGKKAAREELAKALAGLREIHGVERVICTGRNKREAHRDIPGSHVLARDHEGYEAAMGASLIADGLSGGPCRFLVSHLGIRRAQARVTDNLYGIRP